MTSRHLRLPIVCLELKCSLNSWNCRGATGITTVSGRWDSHSAKFTPLQTNTMSWNTGKQIRNKSLASSGGSITTGKVLEMWLRTVICWFLYCRPWNNNATNTTLWDKTFTVLSAVGTSEALTRKKKQKTPTVFLVPSLMAPSLPNKIFSSFSFTLTLGNFSKRTDAIETIIRPLCVIMCSRVKWEPFEDVWGLCKRPDLFIVRVNGYVRARVFG